MQDKQTVIQVENVSKIYKLYDKPLDRLKESVNPWSGKLHRDFYALQNVSFQIFRGETVGIIGKNGSGKSTILKLITGVLHPSSGRMAVHGKIAALIELGAGFNPELTGMDNIFLSGAIMGYNRKEIEARLATILSFADIGDFINQPVKTYSSGMFLRLAFAVAINVEPDILIIDEALSVGDVAFRNKCMARIKELRECQTSILFVSHDLSVLQMICDRAIWLHAGQLVTSGDPVEVCQEYNAFMENGHGFTGETVLTRNACGETQERTAYNVISQEETGMARFSEFRMDRAALTAGARYNMGEDIGVFFCLESSQALEEPIFGASIYRADGEWLLGQTSHEENFFWTDSSQRGVFQVNGGFILKANCLCPGDYRVAIAAYSKDLSICYALTEAFLCFSVRGTFPTWGKFVHPCAWIKQDQHE